MNFGEKVGPLVAELLSGFTLLLLAYFTLAQRLTSFLHEDAAVILGAFTVIAWLIGTLIDALRNVLIEWIWDLFPSRMRKKSKNG
jgi:hypothetical protein